MFIIIEILQYFVKKRFWKQLIVTPDIAYIASVFARDRIQIQSWKYRVVEDDSMKILKCRSFPSS